MTTTSTAKSTDAAVPNAMALLFVTEAPLGYGGADCGQKLN